MKEIDLSPDHTVCTPEGIQTGIERTYSCSIFLSLTHSYSSPPHPQPKTVWMGKKGVRSF